MCSRGVFQLKKMALFFCDHGGSSFGVRDLLTSSKLRDFKALNPQIEFQLIRKRSSHPFVCSTYINGFVKDVPLRNMDSEQIIQQLTNCRNTFGRRAISATGKGVIGAKESIQGKWHLNMWGRYPKAEMQKMHAVKQYEIPMKEVVQKPTKPTKITELIDTYNSVRKTKDSDYYIR